MALITCFECGREISDLAVACPGCGAPGPGRGDAAASSAPAPGAEHADGPDTPSETLEEIRAAWRSEHREPSRPAPFGLGSSLGEKWSASLGEKWSARRILYVIVGITLVAALIHPGLATTAIFAGVVYWAGNSVLAPGGRAATADEGSWMEAAQGFWQRIGLAGRAAVSVAVGVLLGLVTGTL